MAEKVQLEKINVADQLFVFWFSYENIWTAKKIVNEGVTELTLFCAVPCPQDLRSRRSSPSSRRWYWVIPAWSQRAWNGWGTGSDWARRRFTAPSTKKEHSTPRSIASCTRGWTWANTTIEMSWQTCWEVWICTAVCLPLSKEFNSHTRALYYCYIIGIKLFL